VWRYQVVNCCCRRVDCCARERDFHLRFNRRSVGRVHCIRFERFTIQNVLPATVLYRLGIRGGKLCFLSLYSDILCLTCRQFGKDGDTARFACDSGNLNEISKMMTLRATENSSLSPFSVAIHVVPSCQRPLLRLRSIPFGVGTGRSTEQHAARLNHRNEHVDGFMSIMTAPSRAQNRATQNSG
jgi:hypothetical protein